MNLSLRHAFCSLAGLALVTLPTLSASAQVTVQANVPGTSDPWLAGMPNGSTASFGDVAPQQSPVQATGFTLRGGDVFTFSATGSVSYNGGTPTSPPDGQFNFDTTHTPGSENGISDVNMPVDALLGVFLGPDQPSLTAAPGALNFTTQTSQDYLSLSPELKQVFFIGDGRTSTSLPQFVTAPAGATRLFLGGMDGQGWYNNSGSFSVSVTDTNASPVPEASSTLSLGLLLVLGVGGVTLARQKSLKA